MNHFFEIFFILTFFNLHDISKANEVIGCGGFIKSNTEINYKFIKVKLLTPDGAIKYSTEASPVNGYYMIPIYNKGEYILQVSPPPGWSFEPDQINIKVDGENDVCSKNEDINFHFKGFGLSGKVTTQNDPKNYGPSGIKLNLISNNNVIDSTVSGQDGSYYFSNVMPGSYRVEASHPTISFLTNKVDVVLSKENWSAKDDIVVSGFRIEGSVQVQDKSPVKDVVVDLYFADSNSLNVNIKNFVCESKNSQINKNNLRICSVKTDANGKFTFTNIAYGKYKLSSSFSNENLDFEMQPETIQVDLTKNQDVLLSNPFLVSSVSIKCRAFLGKNNEPLTNGQVFVNDQKTPINLNNDGSFQLVKLTKGHYKINIKTDHIYFEEKLLKIDLTDLASLKSDSVNYQQVARFYAKSFDVCGQAKLTIPNDQSINSENLPSLVQIKVFKFKESKPQDLSLIKSINLNKDFKYCFILEGDNDYLVKAELAESLSNIVRLVPDERKIKLVNSPLLDVNFERLEANLNGKIVLLDKKSLTSDLVVTIKSTNTRQEWTRNIQVKCQNDDKSDKYICSFTLNNLFFGSYQLTTNYDDLFCFNTNSMIININSENQNVLIEQTGFKINYVLSHKDANVKVYEIENEKNVLFSKNILTNTDRSGDFCLPKIGKYIFNIESCHRFTDRDNLILIDSNMFKKSSNILKLNALKNRLTVEVLFKFDQTSNSNQLNSADVHVEVQLSNDNTEVIKMTSKSRTQTEIVFTGQTWLAPNQKVKLVPKSNKILFENSIKQIEINENNCDSNFVQFEGKLGIFIQVEVQPTNIDNIELILKSTDDTNNVLQKVSTSSEKSFKFGPLKAPFSGYDVELIKNGYLFKKLESIENKGDTYEIKFQAERLGQLNVNVVESKSNLENVLLSLTSEDRSFRQTIKTNELGHATFNNLKPGVYYLILMMQEYEFKPNAYPIKITDGFEMNLVVEAKRVAYSCYGKVTTINGQSEDQVLVEANAISNRNNKECDSSKENSKVESNGQFRVRNLKPKCDYLISLKHLNEQSNKNILKLIPENYQIKIENQDVKNINFILLDKFENLDLSVAVKYRPLHPDNELQNVNYKLIKNYARIKLFKTNQPDTILQTQYVIVNSIAYFNQLARDSNEQYSVQVEILAPSTLSSLSSGVINQHQLSQLQQQTVLQKTELNFYADSAFKHVLANFSFDRKRLNNYPLDSKQQQYQNVYFTLPLFVLIIGLLLNSKKVQLYLSAFRSVTQQRGGISKFLQSLFSSTSSSAQNSTQSMTSSTFSSSAHNKKSKNSQQLREVNSQNGSDSERSKYAKQSVKEQQKLANSVHFADDTELTASTEEDNDFADLAVVHSVKRRVKKAH